MNEFKDVNTPEQPITFGVIPNIMRALLLPCACRERLV